MTQAAMSAVTAKHSIWANHMTQDPPIKDHHHRPPSIKTRRMTTLTSRKRGTLSRTESRRRQSLRYQLVMNEDRRMELNLSNLALDQFPNEIVNFSRLEVLNLSHNALRDIPGAIGRMRHLKVLLLNHNNLTSLPETLTNCTNLVELNVTRNKLHALPRNIGYLRNLKALRLGENKFESLPHDISQLGNLRALDLHGNRVWYLPFSIQLLNKLQYLNMSDNKFEHLPLPICQVTSLKFVNLRGNRLVSLVQDFECLVNLRELNLAFNKFQIIPPAISKLKNLIYLNLAGNKIHLVPDFLGTLTQLTVFHVQFNEIEKFPNAFPGLHYLNIADNCLKLLAISQMRKLRHLNASNNQLENLPNGIFSASKLEALKLRGNKIYYIPQDIVLLKRLRVLDLGYNRLTRFPKIIDQMAKLDYFNIRGNDLGNNWGVTGDLWPQEYMVVKNDRSSYVPSQYLTKSSNIIQNPARGIPSTHESAVSISDIASRNFAKQRITSNEDLDELLQNGFSLRHIHSNYGSVMQLHKNSDVKKDEESAKTSEVRPTNMIPGLADFGLLGICNQVEMMLNKDLLHPVLSLKRHQGGKSFSDMNMVSKGGVWRLSNHGNNTLVDSISSRQESFTVTPGGGKFISTVEPLISLFVPTKALSKNMQATMRVIRLGEDVLNKVRTKDSVIDNILSIGPLVFLNSDTNEEFKHLVTMTIPPPPGGNKGHLNLVNIRNDSYCTPVSIGYQQSNGSIIVNLWFMEGKTAVMTKAKCKIKACKSVEQLLDKLFTTSTSVEKTSVQHLTNGHSVIQ